MIFIFILLLCKAQLLCSPPAVIKWHNYIAHYSIQASWATVIPASLIASVLGAEQEGHHFEIPNRKEKEKPARHFWPLGAKVMWNYAAEAEEAAAAGQTKAQLGWWAMTSVCLAAWPFGNCQCWRQLPFVCQMAKIYKKYLFWFQFHLGFALAPFRCALKPPTTTPIVLVGTLINCSAVAGALLLIIFSLCLSWQG